jgi:hypothetical protein
MTKILFEGQEVVCPDEIKEAEQAVQWFSAIEPSAKGGQVETIVKGGETCFRIEARAKPKGVANFLDQLKLEKEYINPAIPTALELQKMSQAELVMVDTGKIRKALNEGSLEINKERALLKQVSLVRPRPGEDIPEGF